MATLLELCAKGDLIKLEVPLEPNEMPHRRLFATPEFVKWLEDGLPQIKFDEIYSDLSPLEQVSVLFSDYLTGVEFSDDRRFKPLKWTPDLGIWELKTDDVRIFGWIPDKDAFVCCFGDSADQIKLLDLYGRYITKTSFTMNSMDLNAPKHVDGKEYSDVLSNQY